MPAEDVPKEFFFNKMETFLTCRAVAEKFQLKIDDLSLEEVALNLIYMNLLKVGSTTYSEVKMFMKALPEILTRPFPVCAKLKLLAQEIIIPNLCLTLRNNDVIQSKGHIKLD